MTRSPSMVAVAALLLSGVPMEYAGWGVEDGSHTGMPSTIEERRVVAEDVTVTILSSNLANGNTVGEWGLSALIEVDGACVLFDAGRHPAPFTLVGGPEEDRLHVLLAYVPDQPQWTHIRPGESVTLFEGAAGSAELQVVAFWPHSRMEVRPAIVPR